MKYYITLFLVCALVMAGCSLSIGTDTTPLTTKSSEPSTGIISSLTATPADEKFITLAKQDLAMRLKIDIGQITVGSDAEISGADLASGCTIKGGQVLMPDQSANGYRIVLRANGQEYIYHAGMNNQVILCQNMNPGVHKP